ncbi:MAG: phage tail sheath family protein [Pseudonocardiaceae bacterium]
MTDYLTPGAYFQDVFPPPVQSFLTGVPAFLGRATVVDQDDPPQWLSTPQRLTLWPQFEKTFGGAPDGLLPEAVRSFFENDGLLCYVVLLDKTGPAVTELQRGLAALDDFDDVDLICAPDVMAWATWSDNSRPQLVTDSEQVLAFTGLQQVLLDHCWDRGNRFAILDGVPALPPDPVQEQRDLVQEQRDRLAGEAGGYGALYYPWLWARDGERPLPPCGHLAGIYSRSDQRVGVHKAPANEVIEGVLDLQANLTGPHVGELYEQGVNCLRALPGRGIRVWGARTLSADPTWRDVNARRLVGTISRWVERFMTNLVHEPNDVRLWVRIMRELTAYLDGLFQRGALKGRTADEAFFVKCDNETNPSDVIDAGMVVTQIGVAPTMPAEFIIVRAIHGASGVTVRAA